LCFIYEHTGKEGVGDEAGAADAGRPAGDGGCFLDLEEGATSGLMVGAGLRCSMFLLSWDILRHVHLPPAIPHRMEYAICFLSRCVEVLEQK